MPANRKLKVFRTSIGFHDAYVAAPSRKAALAAWGATTDLFSIGSAEEVTAPKLMAAALDRPGEVIRLSRGSAADHIDAAGKERRPRQKPRHAADGRSVAKSAATERPRRALPRPDRKRLDQAERALSDLEEAEAKRGDILREREAALAREKRAFEADVEKQRRNLEQRLGAARARYDEAMARWREGS